PVYDALVIRIPIRFAREDPGTWFRAEDVFPAQVLDDARSVRARGTIRQDELAQIAEPGHSCPLGGPFDSGPARPPAFGNPLPHRVDQIPRAWILFAKPRAFLRPGKREVEPHRRAVGIGTRIEHVVINVERVDEAVPVPRPLQPERCQGLLELVADPLLHELLEGQTPMRERR